MNIPRTSTDTEIPSARRERMIRLNRDRQLGKSVTIPQAQNNAGTVNRGVGGRSPRTATVARPGNPRPGGSNAARNSRGQAGRRSGLLNRIAQRARDARANRARARADRARARANRARRRAGN